MGSACTSNQGKNDTAGELGPKERKVSTKERINMKIGRQPG